MSPTHRRAGRPRPGIQYSDFDDPRTHMLEIDPFFSPPPAWKPSECSHFDYSQLPTLRVLERWLLSMAEASPSDVQFHRRPSSVMSSNISLWNGFSFTPSHCLKTGGQRYAQVWLGSGKAPQSAESINEIHTVVIKLFVESLFPRDATVVFGGIYAGVEAAAYKEMKDLQGLDIPWSYGFYKFELPNEEIAFGHVMEYIPAPDASVALHPQLSPPPMWTHLGESISQAVHRMHLSGVAHHDIVRSNILLTDPTNWSGVIMIDFAFAEDFNEESELYDADRVISVLWNLQVTSAMAKEWYNRVQTEDWAHMFARVKWLGPTRPTSKRRVVNIRKILDDPMLDKTCGYAEMFAKVANTSDRSIPAIPDYWDPIYD